MEYKKGIISGIVGGIVFTLASLTFAMIPWTSEWYMKAFPQMTTAFAMVMWALSYFAIGLFMGIVYSVVSKAVPGEGAKKGMNYGFMVWLLGLMWPIMMVGFAPVNVWLTSMITALITYTLTGLTIAGIYKKLK